MKSEKRLATTRDCKPHWRIHHSAAYTAVVIDDALNALTPPFECRSMLGHGPVPAEQGACACVG